MKANMKAGLQSEDGWRDRLEDVKGVKNLVDQERKVALDRHVCEVLAKVEVVA